MKGLIFFVVILVMAYGGILGLVVFLQRQLIYFPTTLPEERALQEAQRGKLSAWRDQGGKLMGWKREQNAPYRMLVFHGNAGHAIMRSFYADVANQGLNTARWDFYILEYPGYGAREGLPSRASILQAAGQAVKNLAADNKRPLVLLGESLGTGVSAEMAKAHKSDIAGLLLVTPFTSLADVAAHHYSFLPVRLLLRDNYEVQKTLPDYGGPVGFVLAGRDEVIPTQFGKTLFETYTGPKRQWIDEQATHNTLSLTQNPILWREFEEFLLSN